MDIFYVKIDTELVNTCNRINLKKLQSKIGRYIVDFVGKTVYKILDTEIVTENGKPKFKYSNIQFSITHSNRLVLVAFDEFPLGVDIEFMKDRNFEKLRGHYAITATDKVGFYKQWTALEAKIKLQSAIGYVYNEIFCDEYMLTVISNNNREFIPNLKEINYTPY